VERQAQSAVTRRDVLWKSSATWPRTANTPQDRRIEFRIGIHVGDIIFDDNDIFGEGVIIAARLEGISDSTVSAYRTTLSGKSAASSISVPLI
jgi:class 3 adenylate cyclase